MAQYVSRLIRSAMLGFAVLAIFGCGLTSASVVGAATSVPTATTAPSPTATAVAPTATPTPGHLLVTINPNPNTCSGSGCTPYVCHNGSTCRVEWSCLSDSWPTFTLSNIGQASLTWTGTLNGNGQPTTGWSISANNGSLAGGGSTTVSVHDNPSQIQTTDMRINFTGPAQSVTIELTCGIG